MDIRFDILTEDATILVQKAPVLLDALDSKIKQLARTLKPEAHPPRQDSIKTDLLNLNKTTLEKLIKKYLKTFDSPFNLFYFFLLSLTFLRRNEEISSKKWLESIDILKERLKVQTSEHRNLLFSFFFNLVEEELLDVKDCQSLLATFLKIEGHIPETSFEDLKRAIKTLVSSDDRESLALFEQIALALDLQEAVFIPLYGEKLTLLEYLEYLNAPSSFKELLKEVSSIERPKLSEKERMLFLDACKRQDLNLLKMLLEEGLLIDRLYQGRKEPLFVEIYDKKFLSPQMLSLFLEFGLTPSMHVKEDSSLTFWKYCIDQKKIGLTEVLLLYEASLDTKIPITRQVDFTPNEETLSLFEYALLTRSYEIAALFATHLKADTLSNDPEILDFVVSLLDEEKEEKDQVYLQVIVDALSLEMR